MFYAAAILLENLLRSVRAKGMNEWMSTHKSKQAKPRIRIWTKGKQRWRWGLDGAPGAMLAVFSRFIVFPSISLLPSLYRNWHFVLILSLFFFCSNVYEASQSLKVFGESVAGERERERERERKEGMEWKHSYIPTATYAYRHYWLSDSISYTPLTHIQDRAWRKHVRAFSSVCLSVVCSTRVNSCCCC